jgi:hypothetical protein
MYGIALINSSLTVTSEIGVFCGGFALLGASDVDVAADGEGGVVLFIRYALEFVDFTGTFNVRSTHSAHPGIAVMAADGIAFIEDG